MRSIVVLLACALSCGAQAQAQQKPSPDKPPKTSVVEGRALVVDGDSLVVNGYDIRLWGIDAPELDQTCGDQQAGRIARAFMMHLIDDKPVRCTFKERDRYGRLIMLCTNHDKSDLGRHMVEAGWAWAYTQFTKDYIANEVIAVHARRGVHGMICAAPWAWRRRNSQQPTPHLK